MIFPVTAFGGEEGLGWVGTRPHIGGECKLTCPSLCGASPKYRAPNYTLPEVSG